MNEQIKDCPECAFCTYYDKEENECKKGVWDDDVYLEIDGNCIDCRCYEEKEVEE